jgi:fructan beta-fructosidase
MKVNSSPLLKMLASISILGLVMSLCPMDLQAQNQEISLKISKRYLNMPVSSEVDRARMYFSVDGKDERDFVIRLAPEEADYWVYYDLKDWKGKTLKIRYEGNPVGLKAIYQSDKMANEDVVYHEKTRPQVHFSQRVGWNNDPNGLLYFDGEYHLFFQHNPYEREWENMHWGHAVSRDLVHWTELGDALFPDANGTVFSGSAVIDRSNTSGFGKNAMVAIYTGASSKQVQCLAYSRDKGRSWSKYDGNPFIDSGAEWKCTDTRDPKVFWYAPNSEWVMTLYERDGHSIYTSKNLKDWTRQSHITGFFECPDLVELPVDGDKGNKKWVMYGASGTYMIGSFDGRKFTPENGKYHYFGGCMYAAQTITDAPNGRKIQIGWDQINHPDLPVQGCMTVPTELTLRTTKDGVRLFSEPIKEYEGLELPGGEWKDLSAEEANKVLEKYADADVARIRFTIELFIPTSAGLSFRGQNLVDYDQSHNKLNGSFYCPDDMTSMELTADIIVDRDAVDIFIDHGAYAHYMQLVPKDESGFWFWGSIAKVKSLKINPLKSIWE